MCWVSLATNSPIQDGFEELEDLKIKDAEYYGAMMNAFKSFQKAQELLSDRRFNLDDIKYVFAKTLEIAPSAESHTRMISDVEYRYHVMDTLFNTHFKSLSQPKSWTIEVEMDVNLEGKNGLDRAQLIPKFTDGKLKVTKILS